MRAGRRINLLIPSGTPGCCEGLAQADRDRARRGGPGRVGDNHGVGSTRRVRRGGIQPLVQATDLMYQGAFRLPHGPVGGSSFDYGGTALAFNPARGSLFMVGHDWHQQVAEVTVPAIRRATRVSDLATASVLQPFTDATEGKMYSVGAGTVKVGGLLPYNGKLYSRRMSTTTEMGCKSSRTLSPAST